MIDYLKSIWNLFLLIIKGKKKWVALLYLLLIFRIDFMPDAGGGFAKIIQVFCIGGMMYYIYKYKRNIIGYSYSKTALPVQSLLWLYSYAVCSTLWAILPEFAFFLSLQNIILILTTIWFLIQFKTFVTIERGFLTFAMISMLFEVITLRTQQPVFIAHFLPTASCAALIFSYCVAELLNMKRQDKKRHNFLKYSIIVCLIMLFTNTSGGANASALFGFAMALFFARKFFPCLLLCLSLCFIYFNQDVIEDIILILMPDKNIEQIKTGNGREVIWSFLLRNAAERPILGWGHACIERSVGTLVFEDQILSDAHNNYIGVYGSLGIVGCVFFGVHLVSQLFYSYIRRLRPGYIGIFCATCCAIVNGYSYGYLSGKTCSITVFYFAIVVLTFALSKVKVYDK